MGLLEKIFPKKKEPVSSGFFETLTAYKPAYTSWSGEIYESELVRAAIDAKARHNSKLGITITGTAQPKLRTRLQHRPNSFQTWPQFFYRLTTILEAKNTAFIVKVYDENMETVGIMPILPSTYELIDVNGEPWIRFHFSSGKNAADKLVNIGIMTKFQLGSDFFGDSNTALNQTMELISIQNQAIEAAAENSSSYRFVAKVSNFMQPEDLANERKRFSENNLSGGSGSGLLLFPNTYTDIKQLQDSAYQSNPEERAQIRENIFNYFGVNEDVLQNKAHGDQLDAFYNGAIEPFAVQWSDVVSTMLFTEKELSNGNKIMANANRLQYMTTSEKVSMAQQLGDRGAITINEIRELFNYPPMDEGNHAPIRGEYYFTDQPRPADLNSNGGKTDDQN